MLLNYCNFIDEDKLLNSEKPIERLGIDLMIDLLLLVPWTSFDFHEIGGSLKKNYRVIYPANLSLLVVKILILKYSMGLNL